MLGSVVPASIGRAIQQMGRVKTVTDGGLVTNLRRCLTTTDITLLGIGHMFGAGIYVLTGTVAKDVAGPAIILSFLIAGFASLLAALCYAEFGARVPKAGSAYIYTYVTIGEFWAFVIGWNIILENMIGAASVARAWSGYVDSLFNGAISNSTISTVGSMDNGFLAPYLDPLAAGVTLVYCLMLSLGVKVSTRLNSVLTGVNMAVASFVIVFGLYWADIKNWQGPGGFMPFGVTGVVAGAAMCFYAFVGFDSIATSGEEVMNPVQSIPKATLVSMSFVSVAYIMIGATLTLMVPYNEIHPASSLPDAFAANNVMWAKYIVSIGALCGMTTSLFGSLFSLPRCVYAMASDGLIFSWFAIVSEKTKLPVINMVVCGILTAIIALIFDIEKLVEFMSIGTLMAYTIVSASVIILRYQPAHLCNIKTSSVESDAVSEEIPPTPASPYPPAVEDTSSDDNLSKDRGGQLRSNCWWLEAVVGKREPGQLVTVSVLFFSIISASLCLLVQYGMDSGLNNEMLHNRELTATLQRYPNLYQRMLRQSGSQFTPSWAIVLAVFFISLIVTAVLVISAHHQNNIKLTFSVPLVPLVPLTSIFFNIMLIIHLNPMTWLRFIVWMILGLIVYFGYGIHHSRERVPVSSYTTLLPGNEGGDQEQQPGCVPVSTGAVVNTLQNTISQVTSKVANLRCKGNTDSKLLEKEATPATD